MLDPDDALAMRRSIYGNKDQVTAAEADALFAVNAQASEVSPAWQAFFEEAMLDFVVLQQDPEGYVDDTKADWLIASVSSCERVRPDLIETLIRILEEARSTPAKLSACVLEKVKQAVLLAVQQGGRLERAGVELLRRTVFAAGGDGNIGVTRHEAEALFDINDALKDKPVDPAWTEFFAHAVGNAILFQSTWTPNAVEEVHRQTWLADTKPHVLAQLRSLTDLSADEAAVEEGLRNLAHLNSADDGMGDLVAKQDEVERDADRVTPDEAHWLLGRIDRDGPLDASEHALLAFLRANAATIDPSLSSLLARP